MTCRLFDLPQELQDIIFDYAYGVQSDSTIICKATRDPLPFHLWIRAFPPHKVDEWMVSKRYLRSAAQAWMKAQAFSEEPRFTHMKACTLFIRHQFGLYVDYGVNATIAYKPESWAKDYRALLKCRSLKSLVLIVCYDVFIAVPHKLPWQDLFTDNDLEAILDSYLSFPPGLQQLSIVQEARRWALRMGNLLPETPPIFPLGTLPDPMLATNVEALERVARKRFLRQDQIAVGTSGVDFTTRQNTESGKIYSGSKVSYP